LHAGPDDERPTRCEPTRSSPAMTNGCVPL
jgi:hypothetical protein